MSTMVIVILSVGIPLVYATGCGVTWAVAKERGWRLGEYDLGEYVVVGIWPVALPALLAASATRALFARKKRPDLPKARMVRR